MIKFHENQAWSSWGHSLSDSYLKNDQISCGAAGALEAILQLILNWRIIKFHTNIILGSDSLNSMIYHWKIKKEQMIVLYQSKKKWCVAEQTLKTTYFIRPKQKAMMCFWQITQKQIFHWTKAKSNDFFQTINENSRISLDQSKTCRCIDEIL